MSREEGRTITVGRTMFDAVLNFLTNTLSGLVAQKSGERGQQFVARLSLVLAALIVLILVLGFFLVITGRAGG